MKIGIDGRLWNETGVGRYIRNLVAELQKIDKKNEYVLFVQNKDYERIKKEVIGLSLGRGKLRSKNRKWKVVVADVRWHTIQEQMQFPRIIARENVDLMHFPYFSVPIFYKGPFVVTIHDLIIHHFPTGKASTLPLPLYQLKRFGYKHVMSNAVKRAQKIIVPLYAVKDDLRKTLHVPPEKIVVTYEGFDSHIRKGAISQKVKAFEDTTYFLYVGNAYPHKNLEKLLTAFRFMKKDVKGDIRLVLVGKRDYFYQQLQNSQQDSAVHFLFDVSDSDLYFLYTHAVALVSPSLMEGFGLTPLEAMAAGCLPVVSDIASFREVCDANAVYFDPFQAKDIKEKMENVLHLDEAMRKVFLDKGKERVKDFSWKTMALETVEVYESCTSI